MTGRDNPIMVYEMEDEFLQILYQKNRKQMVREKEITK